MRRVQGGRGRRRLYLQLVSNVACSQQLFSEELRRLQVVMTTVTTSGFRLYGHIPTGGMIRA